MYLTTLGRAPDAQGFEYWSSIDVEEAAHGFVNSPEYVGSGRDIENWYKLGLGRASDSEGLVYWESYPSQADALVGFISTPEAGCGGVVETAPITPLAPSAPAGWVDAGHGVFVPPVLLEVRRCESGHDYNAKNTRSTASGAYQFINSTWRAITGRSDTARDASPADQDRAAVALYRQVSGNAGSSAAWKASRHCWG